MRAERPRCEWSLAPAAAVGCECRSRRRFRRAERIAAARRYVRGRALSSFALIDTHGRLHGFAPRRRYISASVVKAMLLVAYLRKIGNRLPDAAERATLGPMISVSDNGRATSIYGRVGDAGLLDLARRAGMRDLTVAGFWGSVFFSAADQARFFYRFDSLVPKRSRSYARRLLSSIVPAQRWGFSHTSLRRGWSTFFKGGWRQTDSGSLVHEAALFERDGARFSLAVLTDGNPSHDYGTETLRGVARAAVPVTRAALVLLVAGGLAAAGSATAQRTSPRPGRRPLGAPAWSTSTVTRRASAWSSSTAPRRTSPAAACRATVATGDCCWAPPPATWHACSAIFAAAASAC